MLDHMR
jgi:hypothetical protein